MRKYDVIITATKEKAKILKQMVPYCKKNMNVKSIYVIANITAKSEIEKLEEVTFVDESTVFPGLSIDTVGDIIEKISGQRKREGWYLQQFLGFVWAYRCRDDAYIVLDADTFPLNKIEHVSENGEYLFTPKVEYHKPYFDTMDKLFDGKVKRVGDFSFIAEHMIYDCKIMKELISDVESNSNLKGQSFFEKILYAIDKDEILKSGFADYETYGCYIATYYPQKTKLKPLRTQREAVYLIGSTPSESQLEWAAKDYDIISIELADYHKTLMTFLTNRKFIRRLFHMKTLARIRSDIRSIYRKATGKRDFKLENNHL